MRRSPLDAAATRRGDRHAILKRAVALACALSCAALLPVAAQTFVPLEVEVCPASARVYDPEFDAGSQRMVYFDGRTAVRVAQVLPDGRIAGTDCAGTVVARDASIALPGLPFRNGPEWAVSARGLEIAYTRLDAAGRPSMGLAVQARRGWQVQGLPESGERGLPLVSTDKGDAQPRLVYARITGPGTYVLAARDAFAPGSEVEVPGAVDPTIGGAPRWIPGQRALVFAIPDPASGLRQAARLDIDSGRLQFLTGDDGQKDEAWLWHAPEFGGELALMTVANGCCLRFYREVGGHWTLVREIPASSFSPRPTIISPEILVHEGRSYVAMQVGQSRVSASDTWMVAVDPDGLPPVQLSDPARPEVARSEPEWHVTAEGVFVYVSASQARNRFALNRLSTPLAPAGKRLR